MVGEETIRPAHYEVSVGLFDVPVGFASQQIVQVNLVAAGVYSP